MDMYIKVTESKPGQYKATLGRNALELRENGKNVSIVSDNLPDALRCLADELEFIIEDAEE